MRQLVIIIRIQGHEVAMTNEYVSNTFTFNQTDDRVTTRSETIVVQNEIKKIKLIAINNI
jgi:hypothetical protein